jgi:hypothetical protein
MVVQIMREGREKDDVGCCELPLISNSYMSSIGNHNDSPSCLFIYNIIITRMFCIIIVLCVVVFNLAAIMVRQNGGKGT